MLAQHRERLRRLVVFRLDRRLRGRIDPSDVLQQASLEAAQRWPQYLRERKQPFYLWLRFLIVQRVQNLHRRHLKAQRRDARREHSLSPQRNGEAEGESAAALAEALADSQTSVASALARLELRAKLQGALAMMDERDRETLALRHFEQLNNAETAQVLEISEAAASMRYGRALRKLRNILREVLPPS